MMSNEWQKPINKPEKIIKNYKNINNKNIIRYKIYFPYNTPKTEINVKCYKDTHEVLLSVSHGKKEEREKIDLCDPRWDSNVQSRLHLELNVPVLTLSLSLMTSAELVETLMILN